MTKSIEVTGKTVQEAREKAYAQLGLDESEVSIEVIALPKTGFLGIGSQPAKIRASYEAPDEEPAVIPEPAPAPVKEALVKAEPAPAPKAEPKPEKKPAPKAAPKAEPKPEKKPAPKAEPKAEPEAPAAPAPMYGAPVEAGSVEEKIVTFLNGLLARMDTDAQAIITKISSDSIQVELVGSDLGGLIGRRGETLDAIQQLTNYAINHGQSKRIRVHLDAEDYRAKREESLQRLARKTASKAVKSRRNITLEPMNAYERHVIHTALQDYPGVTTYSVGTEPNRRLVVAFGKGEKPEQ